MSMKHYWNDTDRGKWQYVDKNLFRCFVNHKSRMDRREIERGSQRRKIGH